MPRPTPFRCHVFVCVNDRQGARQSCADGKGAEIGRILKERFKQLHPDSVRVSRSQCMGLCSDGPNVMIYPQGLWYSAVKIEKIEEIVAQVDLLLEE